jgi:hypothetical protein
MTISRANTIIKTKLKKYKEVIRWTGMIPLAVLVPIMPVNIILLAIQLICLELMYYVGWD